MPITTSPHDEDVRDGRIGNPRFRAGEPVDLLLDVPLGLRLHPPGIRAVIGLGQPETADLLAGGQRWNVFLFLLFAT